jgi:dTMP kinase
MKKHPGLLITFEGIEASGKSTHSRKLASFLRKEKIDHVLTREPGGTAFGRRVKNLIFDPPGGRLSEVAELLLFGADRAEHVATVILPALRAGKIVICDRFIDSTTAYQEAGRQLDPALVKTINGVSSGGLKPDLTVLFLLDLKDLSEMNRRLLVRGHKINRFEKEKYVFYRRIQAGYLRLARRESRFLVLKGREPIASNAALIKSAVLKKISRV